VNIMTLIKKIHRNGKGQSMVEMAIILPVLLLILFAIFEFGRILGAYMLIHDLARDGVRYGVVGMSDQSIKDHIMEHDSFLNINSDDINITPSIRSLGSALTVGIDYEIEIITPIISSIVPNPINLRAEYVMRVEKLPQ
jgi:Flp pilus assembly protein TadG